MFLFALRVFITEKTRRPGKDAPEIQARWGQ